MNIHIKNICFFRYFPLLRNNKKKLLPMQENYILIFAGIVVVIPAIFLIAWLTSRKKN
jgi:hypothetical protein